MALVVEAKAYVVDILPALYSGGCFRVNTDTASVVLPLGPQTNKHYQFRKLIEKRGGRAGKTEGEEISK